VNCPRDVRRDDFLKMMDEARKEDRILLRSKRRLWVRDFTFLFHSGRKLGSTIQYSLACKFKVRRA
jgi:hypothetical protein